MAQDEEARLEEKAGGQADGPPDAAQSSQPPQPCGEPEPVDERRCSGWGLVVTGLTITGGMLFLAVAISPGYTCGATRSSKLQFEQRRELIEQAARQEAQVQQLLSADR